jgi:hypothetical protein
LGVLRTSPWVSLAFAVLATGCLNSAVHLPPVPGPDDAGPPGPGPDDGGAGGTGGPAADGGPGISDAGSRPDGARDGSLRDALPVMDAGGGTGTTDDASPPVINNLMTQERWATQQGGFWDTQKWVAGDFDGDGRTDLANVFGDPTNASIDIRRRPHP